MEESATKFLRRMCYTEEKTIKIINELKKCAYRSDARCGYDLMAGGLFWEDEIPYQSMFNCKDMEYEFDEKQRISSSCSIYLRGVFAYRASLTKGKPRKDCQEEWDELKNRVPTWPGFREERIFGENIKRMLEKTEKEMWGEDYDEAMDGD